MIIRINPLDTFFFRDARPFEMGEESWANSIFPPSPSVIYGALRSLWISQQEGGFTDDNIKISESLKINGVFLEFNEKTETGDNWNIHFPVPRDFVKLEGKRKKDNTQGILELEKFEGVANYDFEYFATKRTKKNLQVENLENLSLFHKEDFEKYVKGVEETKLTPILNYLTSEPKIGIAKNKQTKVSEEGRLYRVEMQRFGDYQFYKNRNHKRNPENMRILVDFEFPQFNPKTFFLKLGGEGKIAHSLFDKKENIEQIPFPELISKDDKTYFKVCLLSPCIFENGIFPKWYKQDTYNDLNLKILSIIADKPISIGGFDMQADNGKGGKGYPKTMRKAMPSGSIYYFECEGTGTAIEEKIKQTFHYQNISDFDSQQGFGLSIVAKPQINF